jgi:hypothetical protein
MQLLVGNPTLQTVQFHYRVPEVERALIAEIPPGSQVHLMPMDLSEAQIKAVIPQLERYGGVPESDVVNLKTAHSLIFSVRKPITENQLNTAREKDEQIRQKISDQETENAGVATIPSVLPQAIQQRMQQTQQNSTLHVEQISNLEGEHPQTIKGGVNTTVTVSKKAGARERKVG